MSRIIIVAMLAAMLYSQSNVWVKSSNVFAEEPGCKHMSAMVYSSDSNRFISTLGWVFNGSWNPASRYSDLSLRLPDTRWINHFPKDSLFGFWGDSTGNVSGLGNNLTPTFSLVAGFMRPGLFTSAYRSFYQYAYNSDDYCIYHYMANKLLRYNTRTRLWDTLSASVHPANAEGGDWPLKWGSICYDAYNKEIVLFGGADVDVRNGNCGTWTFKPSTGLWTKLSPSVEPPPRCLSQLVYDAKNRCIIVFGGDHLDYLTADTWVYDCVAKQWSQKSPARSPSPRAGHALVYLPKSQSVVLIGGYNYTSGYNPVNPFEMWKYDPVLNEWKLIKAFGTSDIKPKWVFHSIMAADTGDNIVALGDSSAYGGFYKLTYTMKCDPSVIDETGTLSRGVVAGSTVRRTGASDPAWYNTDIAAPNTDSIEALYTNLTPNVWHKMNPPKLPNKARDWSTLAFDPITDNVLIWGGGHSAYCGSEVSHYTMGKDRWSIGYEPEQMLNLNGDGGNSGYHADYFTFNNRPFMPGHTRKAYCYSTVHKRMIAHNYGTKYTYVYDPVKMDYDTTRILRPSVMPRSTTSYCVNDTRHGVFLWIGGGDLYLLDTSNVWKKLYVKNGTKAPSYYDLDAGSSYDSKRDRVLMVSKGAGIGKVWAYSFVDSTLTSYTPGGAYNSVNSFWRDPQYLPDLDMLFVGGDSSSSLYDCEKNEWAVLKTTRGAGVISTITGSNAAYTYDPKRNIVIAINTGWNSMHVYIMRVNADSLSVSNEKVASEIITPDNSSIECSPVPFNPINKISVSLKTESNVVLAVYDLSGKLIKTISKDKFCSGKHNFSWNATDNYGRKVPSAVYVYFLKVGNKIITKKTILAR